MPRAGESLLRAMFDRISLAILLCMRTEAEHLVRRPDVARKVLAEAEDIAGSVGASSDSELRQAIQPVRNVLG